MKRLTLAGMILLAATAAQAKQHELARVKCVGLFCGLVSESGPRHDIKPATWRRGWTHSRGHRRVVRRAYVRAPRTVKHESRHGSGQIVAHPAGCPHIAFCGCGTAVRIFGAPIRSLWLAARWLRFPPAMPAPGMIAVRRDGHHVFAIERVIDRDHVLAFDPNSGRHLTRLHVVSLRNYSVRNPRG